MSTCSNLSALTDSETYLKNIQQKEEFMSNLAPHKNCTVRGLKKFPRAVAMLIYL